MGERIDVEAGGQRIKGKGQKGERNQKRRGEKTAGWREKRSTEEEKNDVGGERKEKKKDGGEEKEGEETRQRRNSCCYLSADDLQRGRATDSAAA